MRLQCTNLNTKTTQSEPWSMSLCPWQRSLLFIDRLQREMGGGAKSVHSLGFYQSQTKRRRNTSRFKKRFVICTYVICGSTENWQGFLNICLTLSDTYWTIHNTQHRKNSGSIIFCLSETWHDVALNILGVMVLFNFDVLEAAADKGNQRVLYTKQSQQEKPGWSRNLQYL